MLKFFYRLKKRGGVVLFAVVAIMTLLIVMASVAYFTARSSYKTVLSNYDFSQTYLSATSIADMMLSAVAFESSRDTDNNYKSLRTLIGTIENEVQEDMVAEGELDEERDITEIHYTDGKKTRKIIYYNKEITDGVYYVDKTPGSESEVEKLHNELTIKGASHTDEVSGKFGDDLLQSSMDDPVKGGILDGCEVSISLDWVKTLPVDKEDDKYKSNRFYYTFTTTAYYRGNSITVQDTVYHDSTLGASAGLPQFDTFFTATGQNLGDKGKIKGADRMVVINTKTISDNAYFQNNDTVITAMGGTNSYYGQNLSTTGVNFAGGLQSSGNVWLDADSTGTFPKPDGDRRHDWIIGGDLYVSRNAKLDFNGNCLYVKGDLYLASDAGNPFTNLGAAVVEGNIYILNSSIDCFTFADYNSLGLTGDNAKHKVTPQGIYVHGEDHLNQTGVPGGIYKSNTTDYVYDWVTVKNPGDVLPDKFSGYPTSLPSKYKDYHSCGTTEYEQEKEETVSGVTVVHHYLTIGQYKACVDAKISESNIKSGMKSEFSLEMKTGLGNSNTFSGDNLYFDSGMEVDSAFAGQKKGDFTDLPGHISKLIPVEEDGESKYVYNLNYPVKVSEILSPDQGLKKKDFDSYSAKQTTFNNVLELDFTKVTAPGTTVLGQVNGDGESATITVSGSDNLNNCQSVVIDLPYVKDGYVLKWKMPKGNIYGYQFPDGSWGTKSNTNVFPGWDQNATVTYRIHTGDKTELDGKTEYQTMPIVLTANFCDDETEYKPEENKYGSPNDENGCNAFSWTLGKRDESTKCVVELVNEDGTDTAEGFVLFEMGNYTPGGSYEKFKKENSSSLESVIYYASQKQAIGTKAQIDYFKSKGIIESLSGDGAKSAINDMYENKETGHMKSEYENKIILVSNKNNNKKAFVTGGFNSTTLCGYVYAPNGSFAGIGKNEAFPVIGGMIVSDYTVVYNHFMYATPNPDLVQGLADGLENITTTTSDAVNIWYVDGDDLGKNYLG